MTSELTIELAGMLRRILENLDANWVPYEGTYLDDELEADAKALLKRCEYSENK